MERWKEEEQEDEDDEQEEGKEGGRGGGGTISTWTNDQKRSNCDIRNGLHYWATS